jgi:hypothetical protein
LQKKENVQKLKEKKAEYTSKATALAQINERKKESQLMYPKQNG